MANERIALVIGNAAYRVATPLETPVNDAANVEAVLRRLDFDVQSATDCSISEFQRELRRFTSRIDNASVALFYYSGHALQYDGDNYLIPVDARLEVADDLERLAFQVTPQLKMMRGKAAVSLVFLDACRDNPFNIDETEPTARTKRVVIKPPKGLLPISRKELQDAFVAYAAEQGSWAIDGDAGDVSPFTKALCEHIETPGLDLGAIMQRVKKSVGEATEYRQRPWSNDSLTRPFFFKPVAAAGQSPVSTEIVRADGSGEEPPEVHDETAALPQEPAPEPPTPRGVSAWLPNLAAGIEVIARKAGPMALGVMSIMVAFSLFYISQWFHLALINLPGTGKQVGFMAAPNWLIVYLILFPFYLYLFAILTDRVRTTLVSLSKQKVIVCTLGRPVSEQRVLAAWKQALQKISPWLWGMLLFIVVQTGGEWWNTCFLPYFGGDVTVVDWTTSAIGGSELQRTRSIAFSAMAYLYMGVALYVYLAILVYAWAACNFLYTIADPTGEFRMVLRDETLGKQLSAIGTVIYWSVILGLCAGFMMRLQAVYLASGQLLVTDLLLNDVLTWLGQPPATSTGAAGGATPSAWTGFFEMIFTLLALFGCCVSLYNALDRAKQYYLDNIDQPAWRKMMGINPSRIEIDRVRQEPLLKALFPKYVHLGFVVAGVFLSGVFIGHGVVPLVTLIYLVVAFVIVPGLRGDRMAIAKKADAP